jgi:hypothetical protein
MVWCERALHADGGNRRPLATLLGESREEFAEAASRILQALGQAR